MLEINPLVQKLKDIEVWGTVFEGGLYPLKQ